MSGVKVTNANQPGERAYGVGRGHTGTGIAGTPGMTFRDGSATARKVRDLTFLGMTITDNGDGTAVARVDESSLSGTINVKDSVYGAEGDGVTDDTDAINDAIAALNGQGGGILYFPGPANYRIVTGPLTTITVPCLVLGDGGAETDPVTLITMEDLGHTLFTFSVGGSTVRGIKFLEDSGDSNASALLFSDADRARVEECTVIGFSRGIAMQASRYFSIRGCFIATEGDCVTVENAGSPDQGDWSMIDNVIGPGVGGSGILILQSGGGRIIGNKINAGGRSGTHGIFLDMDGTDATGILLIKGNSIENTGAEPIRLETADTATFHSANITGNQFAMGGNTTTPAIVLTGAAQGDQSRNVIALNEFHASGNGEAAIDLTNVTDSYIGPNVWTGFASLLSMTTCDGVVDGTGSIAEGVQITGVPAAGQVPVATSSTAAEWSAPPATGLGPLLLASDHATPIDIGADVLQASDGADLLYASEP